MKPNYIWILFVLLSLNIFAQRTMKYFSPESQDYGIYFPDDFLVGTNHEDNIVTFTDLAEGGINITVSSYIFENKAAAKAFIVKFAELTEIKKEEWPNDTSKFDDLIKGSVKKGDNDYWTWWYIVKDNHAMSISINKPTQITDEDTGLLKYMIENLDI